MPPPVQIKLRDLTELLEWNPELILLAEDEDGVAYKIKGSLIPGSGGGSGSLFATKVVADQAARLALTSELAEGFIVLDSDTGKSWGLVTGGTPATSGDWVQVGDRDIVLADVTGLVTALAAKAGINGELINAAAFRTALGIDTLNIIDAVPVANAAARLALSADAARNALVRETDTGISYMLVSGGVPATSGDWLKVADITPAIADIPGLQGVLDALNYSATEAREGWLTVLETPPADSYPAVYLDTVDGGLYGSIAGYFADIGTTANGKALFLYGEAPGNFYFAYSGTRWQLHSPGGDLLAAASPDNVDSPHQATGWASENPEVTWGSPTFSDAYSGGDVAFSGSHRVRVGDVIYERTVRISGNGDGYFWIPFVSTAETGADLARAATPGDARDVIGITQMLLQVSPTPPDLAFLENPAYAATFQPCALPFDGRPCWTLDGTQLDGSYTGIAVFWSTSFVSWIIGGVTAGSPDFSDGFYSSEDVASALDVAVWLAVNTETVLPVLVEVEKIPAGFLPPLTAEVIAAAVAEAPVEVLGALGSVANNTVQFYDDFSQYAEGSWVKHGDLPLVGNPLLFNHSTPHQVTAYAVAAAASPGVSAVTAGNATVTVTGRDIVGSPLAVSVALANGDDDVAVAVKIKAALNALPAITNFYAVGGTVGDVAVSSITHSVVSANDWVGYANVIVTSVPHGLNPGDTFRFKNFAATGAGGASAVTLYANNWFVVKTVTNTTTFTIEGTTFLGAITITAGTVLGKPTVALLAKTAPTYPGFSTYFDPTLNVAITNGTCTGLLPKSESYHTQGGAPIIISELQSLSLIAAGTTSGAGAGIATMTVTGRYVAGGTVVIPFTVGNSTSAITWAQLAIAAFNNHPAVNQTYIATGIFNQSIIFITAKSLVYRPFYDPTLTVDLAPGTTTGISVISGSCAANDIFTTTAAHGFTTGNTVHVRLAAGGSAPSGLILGKNYYVSVLSSTTFNLREISTNTLVDVGIGTNLTFMKNTWVSGGGERFLLGSNNSLFYMSSSVLTNPAPNNFSITCEMSLRPSANTKAVNFDRGPNISFMEAAMILGGGGNITGGVTGDMVHMNLARGGIGSLDFYNNAGSTAFNEVIGGSFWGDQYSKIGYNRKFLLTIEANETEVRYTAFGKTITARHPWMALRAGGPETHFWFEMGGDGAGADYSIWMLHRWWANSPAIDNRQPVDEGGANARLTGGVLPHSQILLSGQNSIIRTFQPQTYTFVAGGTSLDAVTGHVTGGASLVEGRLRLGWPTGSPLTGLPLGVAGIAITDAFTAPLVSAAGLQVDSGAAYVGLGRATNLPNGMCERFRYIGTFGDNANGKRFKIKEAGGTLFDTGTTTEAGTMWELEVLRVSHVGATERWVFKFFSPGLGTIMNTVAVNRGATFTAFQLHVDSPSLGDVTMFWRLGELLPVT